MERFKDVLSGNIERGVSPDVVAAHVLTQEDRASRLLERQLLRPSVSGPKIKRYHAWNVDQFIVYTTRSTPIKEFPKALDHLSRFRARQYVSRGEGGEASLVGTASTEGP